jgi:hypothetical protein
MRAFLGTVLSLIAAGVLLIAYGLLVPRGAAVAPPVMYGSDQLARPIYASERLSLSDGPLGSTYGAPRSIYPPARRAVSYQENPVTGGRLVPRYASWGRPAATPVAVDRGRDWKRTAMVIGGSTAAAAGLGAIFGGKKGALIGAALGGGASTLYEVRRQ